MSISKIVIIDMVEILIKLNIEKTLFDLSEVYSSFLKTKIFYFN